MSQVAVWFVGVLFLYLVVFSIFIHYSDVIMGATASQITSLTIVYSTVYSDADQRNIKLRVTGLCAANSPGPVNSPYKWPVTRKMFLFDDVIMSARATENNIVLLFSMTSLKLGYAYMRVWTEPYLFRIMALLPSSEKLSPELIPAYCQLDR